MAVALLAVFALAVGGYLAIDLPQKSRIEKLSTELDARLAEASLQRWERPPLRGEAIPGNAADQERDVLDAMGTLDAHLFDDFSRKLRDPAALPPPLVALVAAKREGLAALREATRGSFATSRVDLRKGASVVLPVLTPTLRASKLLQAQAALSEPGQCLPIAADAVRLAHDGASNVGMVGLMVSAAAVTAVPIVVAPCARRASQAERRAAAAEFLALSSGGPLLGRSLRDELLIISVEMRTMARATHVIPTPGTVIPVFSARGPGAIAVLDLIRQRPLLLDAWSNALATSARWAPLTAAAYPAVFDQIDRDTAAMLAASPLSADFSGNYRRYVDQDAQATARLRVVAAGLAMLAEGNTSAPTAPPLADPFTGTPLRLRPAAGAARPGIYSVGINRRDEGGADGTDDVVFEL
jgi:hypothetical protein